MAYGLPYMGSKNSIAPKIISVLPKAENFYDLFCGGCAITECAMLSKKWNKVYFNDLDGDVPQLFLDAIDGKYKDRKEWVSREDFFRLKDKDAYIRLAWSFGNKGNTYLYSREIEPYKKAYWYAVMYDDFSLLWKLGINIPKVKAKSFKDKRLELKKRLEEIGGVSLKLDSLPSLTSLERIQRLQNLKSLQRLGRIQSLEKLGRQNIELTKLSYDEVEIKPNSILYCDIPYEGTTSYVIGAFNHKKFYDWACEQKELVVISSYNINDDRFQRVVNFKKRSLLSANGTADKKDEGLFVPKTQINLWKKLKENR